MVWFVWGYWCLAALAAVAGFLLLLQTWEHSRFAHSRVWDFNFNFNPIISAGHIALVAPCKGADAEFEANLRPLFEQDHADYELVFAVESADDPACAPIRRLMARYPAQAARLVVAGLATDTGQKVHNLLAATENLSATVDIVAFVDADVRPPRDWLRLLTQRLNHFAAATGYRWCVPKRPTLANCIVASIDSSVVPIMFPGAHHIVWGGSWAIRRKAFEEFGLREAWRGTLSDDLVAANVLARFRSEVSLEPACILPTTLDMDMRSMFAFVRRQFMIGRDLLAPFVERGAGLELCHAGILLGQRRSRARWTGTRRRLDLARSSWRRACTACTWRGPGCGSEPRSSTCRRCKKSSRLRGDSTSCADRWLPWCVARAWSVQPWDAASSGSKSLTRCVWAARFATSTRQHTGPRPRSGAG